MGVKEMGLKSAGTRVVGTLGRGRIVVSKGTLIFGFITDMELN